MNAIVYVNTPLEAPEHAALAALARREGRAKGQQLRLLAIQAMRGAAVHSEHDAGTAPRTREKEGARAAATRVRACGAAGAHLAPAADAMGAGAPAAERESKSISRSKSKNTTTVTGKGGRV